ncbi:MAG: ribonuclease H [Gemmatimonadota bacterium]
MKAPVFHGLVYIHADESCLGNQFGDRANPGGAAGLIEVFDERRGWTRRDYYVSARDTTNQRMALRSGIEGLKALTKPCRVCFYSDSNYLVTGMKDWVHGWARRGWKRKGGPIENLDLWIQLVKVAARHYSGRNGISWRWVRGHAGDPKNEYVNELAVDAARGQKNSRSLIESGFDAWVEAEQEKERLLDFLDLPPTDEFSPDSRPPNPPMPHDTP